MINHCPKCGKHANETMMGNIKYNSCNSCKCLWLQNSINYKPKANLFSFFGLRKHEPDNKYGKCLTEK